MTITWSPSNADNHFSRHHVSFDQAKRVFTAPDRKCFKDQKPNKYNEERWIMIGTVDKRKLYVVYTKTQDVIRIISARRLTKRQMKASNLQGLREAEA